MTQLVDAVADKGNQADRLRVAPGTWHRSVIRPKVDWAAIPLDLITSELFDYGKGRSFLDEMRNRRVSQPFSTKPIAAAKFARLV